MPVFLNNVFIDVKSVVPLFASRLKAKFVTMYLWTDFFQSLERYSLKFILFKRIKIRTESFV